MAAFTAYFDASGKEADQPCLAVAGFVAAAGQWLEFERAWLDRLKKDGLEYFHVSEINQSPEFRNDPERTKRLYVDLIQIISEHGTRKVGCCVVSTALGRLSPEERKAWNICAYSVAGRGCGAQIRQWCRGWSGSLPEFIFECGDDGVDDLRAIFERGELPKPIFKPKKDIIKGGVLSKAAVPLQAADLLAFECFDPIRKYENDGYLKRIRPSFKALENIPGSLSYIDADRLQDLYVFESLANDELWLPTGPSNIPFTSLRQGPQA